MTIIVNIKPEVQAELARQAAAHGRAIEAHVASLLEEAVQLPPRANGRALDKERAQAAGARIRELRKGVTLGGLTIRQLIDEGRPGGLSSTILSRWRGASPRKQRNSRKRC
jgi:plasmid stability protein